MISSEQTYIHILLLIINNNNIHTKEQGKSENMCIYGSDPFVLIQRDFFHSTLKLLSDNKKIARNIDITKINLTECKAKNKSEKADIGKADKELYTRLLLVIKLKEN